jgi:hypothetical protein
LVSAPILRRPIAGKTYQLHTDWSSLGIGTVLTQMDDDGKEFVIAYATSPTTTRKHNIAPMKGSAWPLFGQLLTFDVTCIVMSSYW